MIYKVTKASDAFEYEAGGHFKCAATRLHTATDFEGGEITMGLTHFLPNGGSEMKPANWEMVYYVQSGELTIRIGNDNTEHHLCAGDSIRFMPGCERGILNESHKVAEMLVIMVVKKK